MIKLIVNIARNINIRNIDVHAPHKVAVRTHESASVKRLRNFLAIFQEKRVAMIPEKNFTCVMNRIQCKKQKFDLKNSNLAESLYFQ